MKYKIIRYYANSQAWISNNVMAAHNKFYQEHIYVTSSIKAHWRW